MGQLTTEQVLLLNNIMYMNNGGPFPDIADYENATVGDYIQAIDTGKLSDNKEYTAYTTGGEWKDIIEAVKADETLCDVEIKSCYTNSKDGQSVFFSNGQDNEAVVIYRGTGSGEWKDNFLGGGPTDAPDGVSTKLQQDALEWYQSLDLDSYESVTVSGHSKGGNKAKYVTVMDDSVDRCLSFDGQGFSDEFINEYRDNIADRQYKIENHNVSGDYVNILLNDIGDTTFYEGYNYGDGRFLENHCPNTFMKFAEDGTFQMTETGQDREVQILDEFLNNYIRSLPETERAEAMEMFGVIAEQCMNTKSDRLAQELIQTLLDEDNTDEAAELLAYLVRYEQENPELADAVRNVLHEMGMDDAINIVDIVDTVLSLDSFDFLWDAVDFIGGIIPDWILDKLADLLYANWGLELSGDDLEKFFQLLRVMNRQMDQVVIKDNGADIKVKDSVGRADGNFEINTSGLKYSVQILEKQRREIQEIRECVEEIRSSLNASLRLLRVPLATQRNSIEKCGNSCQILGERLREISNLYEKAERTAVTNLYKNA